MKIKVKYEVSSRQRSDSFKPEDLGFTENEWKELSYDQKQEALMEAAENDQPYWVVDTFEEIWNNFLSNASAIWRL